MNQPIRSDKYENSRGKKFNGYLSLERNATLPYMLVVPENLEEGKDFEKDIVAVKEISMKPQRQREEKRRELEKLIEAVPSFQTSLRPMVFNGEIPPLALNMVSAANRCDVGPMAAVAGAFSEIAWQYLRNYGSEIIVENGGDIVSDSQKERIIKVFAGPSIFSGKIGIKLSPGKHGICTSSGTVGPSLSFGQADAVVIISKSASLADAAATAGGNRIQNSDDFKGALAFLQAIDGVDGILMIKEDKMLAWGNLEVVPLN